MLNAHAIERDVATGLAVIRAATNLGGIPADNFRVERGVEARCDRRLPAPRLP